MLYDMVKCRSSRLVCLSSFQVASEILIHLCRWIFEKYDGIRGFWNPHKKLFLFSAWEPVASAPRGNGYNAGGYLPGWRTMVRFGGVARLPDFRDRFGRGTFQEAMKISNRVKAADVDWENFRYMVYDLPKHEGTYEERYSSLGTLFLLLCG